MLPLTIEVSEKIKKYATVDSESRKGDRMPSINTIEAYE